MSSLGIPTCCSLNVGIQISDNTITRIDMESPGTQGTDRLCHRDPDTTRCTGSLLTTHAHVSGSRRMCSCYFSRRDWTQVNCRDPDTVNSGTRDPDVIRSPGRDLDNDSQSYYRCVCVPTYAVWERDVSFTGAMGTASQGSTHSAVQRACM